MWSFNSVHVLSPLFHSAYSFYFLFLRPAKTYFSGSEEEKKMWFLQIADNSLFHISPAYSFSVLFSIFAASFIIWVFFLRYFFLYMKWYEHILRTEKTHVGQQTMGLEVHGKRKRVRPRRWVDCVKQDVRQRNWRNRSIQQDKMKRAYPKQRPRTETGCKQKRRMLSIAPVGSLAGPPRPQPVGDASEFYL